MSEWVCPDCNGGFPRAVKVTSGWACPWCKAEIRGYDSTQNNETIEDKL